jgi:adenine-specific DNA-methyltransferase
MLGIQTNRRAQLLFADEERAQRKAFGVYYTPEYIVRVIVANTLGRLCAKIPLNRVEKIRILDPACGAGAFLLGAYRWLLKWHGSGSNGERPLTAVQRLRILRNSIYGVDIDAAAVEVARQSLVSEALKEEGPIHTSRAGIAQFTSNIRHGNALLGADFGRLGVQFGAPPFEWHTEFPDVMHAGGFDVVLGNPPYSAALSEAERDHLTKAFSAGTTDTAALLMLQAYRLTRPGGWNGFIVPKPFAYASSWRSLRTLFLNDLRELTDAGKVWQDVKLEQVIYTLQKARPRPRYVSFQRRGENFTRIASIPKDDCETFDFYLNGIGRAELAVARKLRGAGAFLGDFTTNVRGATLQGRLQRHGELRAIGGKQVRLFHLRGQKAFVADSARLPSQATVKPRSILVQNIVAHISHPVAHIQIIGCIVSADEARRLAILDTVNQLSNHSHLSSHYLLALLSSRLLNWYIYHFIFARAIRTLHFDGPVSRRIPIPDLNLSRRGERICHARLVALAKSLARLSQAGRAEEPCLKERIAKLRRQIDQEVHALYRLTSQEIVVVNGSDSAAHEDMG